MIKSLLHAPSLTTDESSLGAPTLKSATSLEKGHFIGTTPLHRNFIATSLHMAFGISSPQVS